MSQVKKYDPFGYDGLSALMTECEHGDYVRHEDYAALEAELAKLEAGMPRLMQANYDLRQERDAALAERDRLRVLLGRVHVSMTLDDTEWGFSGEEKYTLLADIKAALSNKP